MFEILPFLKSLISIPGLSGYESSVREAIADAWRPLTDELNVSRLGSLHGLKRGLDTQEQTETKASLHPRPSILIAAHMDAIGLMVSSISSGFLRVTAIGGLDSRVLPGQFVTIHGRQDLEGMIVQPPTFLLPPQDHDAVVDIQYLFVDTGLPAHKVSQLVRVGDLISFAQPPVELDGDTLTGHSLDNRASVAALTQCLFELQGRKHLWDVWAVATVQEEINLGGALTSAFQLQPQLAIAVDVTWAKGVGDQSYKTFPLGKGPTLGWGPNVHSGLYHSFRELANRHEIPYHTEILPPHSGTEAFTLQIAREGIPTMVVLIPLRYMHTPVETVSIKDIARTGHLLAEFISALAEDYMDRLSWDNKA